MPFTPGSLARRRRPPAARRPLLALVLTAVLCAFTSSLSAQTTTLSGIVHDPNGRVAEGVPVVAERLGAEPDPARRWETVSTDIGYYEFPKLPPGQYRITIELPPFRPVTAEVAVQPGHRAVLDIALRLGSDERVTVEGKAASRPLGAMDLGGVATVAQFSRRDLDEIALTNGRTVQSLQLMVPGLLVTDSVGTLAQFTAIGQRRFANRMTIDGVSADLGIDIRGNGVDEGGAGTLPAFATSGGTQTLVSMEAIEEIQVRTTNAQPEHARTPGAQTSIVTRSGGDRMAGTGYLSNRPDAWTASDWFANAGRGPRRDLSYWNGGATLGGPLLARRLFYFASWEGQRSNRPATATNLVPSAEARDAAAAAGRDWLRGFPMPNGRVFDDGTAEFTATFPVRSSFSTTSLRLDTTIGGRHRFFARANQGHSHGDAAPDGLSPQFTYVQPEKANIFTVTGGVTSTLSPAVANDLRVNVSENRGRVIASQSPFGNAQALPLEELAPPGFREDTGLFFQPLPGVTVLSGQMGASRYRQVEIADTLSYVSGRHQVRAGFAYNRSFVTSDTAAHRYNYRFASVGEMIAGRLRLFTHLEQIDARADRQTVSAFAQDTIRLSARLTVDAGLRYRVQPAPTSGVDTEPLLIDFASLPGDVRTRPTGAGLWDTQWGNIAPHVGVTYQARATEGRETLVRAGWDRIYDDLAAPGISALTRGYPFIAARNAGGALPLPEDRLSGPIVPFASDNVSEYYSLPTDLRAPRTTTWQLGVEQALGAVQRVSLAYVGARGRDLLYPSVYYASAPRAKVVMMTNDARSDYHALLAEYVRRWSRGWQARAAYTWSHAIDTHSGETASTVANPAPWLVPPALNRGSADFDRRHALQVSASYRLPDAAVGATTWRKLASEWQLDVTGILRSGAPIDLETFANFGGATYKTRPDILPGVPLWLDDPAAPAGRRVNPDAFGPHLQPVKERAGTFGRNVLRGTWLRQMDLALSRNVRLHDRVAVQLRIEAFNVFNTPNFGAVNSYLDTVRFGESYQSTAESLGAGTLTRGGLMPIQQIGGPRSLQLSVRASF